MRSMNQKYKLSKLAESDLTGGRSYEHVRQGYRKTADGGAMISRILHEKMDYDRHL